MNVAGVVEVLGGLGVVSLAIVSRQERLPRNGFAGVRTRSTMRSDEAFTVANKAAAPLTGAGGAVMAAGGLLTAVLPGSTAESVLLGGATGCVVLCVLGAVKGVRACR